MKNPEIFFHVGLGKTASTYLQHRVFPALKNISYIPTRNYKKSKSVIEKSEKTRFLISREFDRQFDEEVEWFCTTYPEAHIIVVFRRHDKWIGSQYRRHVKGGFYGDFNDFIDVENNEGFWDRKELIFMDKIKTIERFTKNKPLILFHEDLKKDPDTFISSIAKYCNSTIDLKEVSFKPKHTAWSDQQLTLLKNFRKRFLRRPIRGGRNRLEGWLYYRPWWLFFHLIMYFALLLPKKMIMKQPLINDLDLKKVREHTENDWESLRAYANQTSPAK